MGVHHNTYQGVFNKKRGYIMKKSVVFVTLLGLLQTMAIDLHAMISTNTTTSKRAGNNDDNNDKKRNFDEIEKSKKSSPKKKIIVKKRKVAPSVEYCPICHDALIPTLNPGDLEELSKTIKNRQNKKQDPKKLFDFLKRQKIKKLQEKKPTLELPCALFHKASKNHIYHEECITTWFDRGFDKCPLCNASIPVGKKNIEAVKQLCELQESLKTPATFDLSKHFDLIGKYNVNIDAISDNKIILNQAMPFLKKIIFYESFEKIVQNCFIIPDCPIDIFEKDFSLFKIISETRTDLTFLQAYLESHKNIPNFSEKLITLCCTLINNNNNAVIEILKFIIDKNMKNTLKNLFVNLAFIIKKGELTPLFVEKIILGIDTSSMSLSEIKNINNFPQNSLIMHILNKNNNDMLKITVLGLSLILKKQLTKDIQSKIDQLNENDKKETSFFLEHQCSKSVLLYVLDLIIPNIPKTNGEFLTTEILNNRTHFIVNEIRLNLKDDVIQTYENLCKNAIIKQKSFTILKNITTYFGGKKQAHDLFINQLENKSHTSTYLHWAAQNNMIEFAQWLLENGEDVNAITTHLETALHMAKTKEMQQLLINYDADTNALDINKKKPILDPSIKLKNICLIQ